MNRTRPRTDWPVAAVWTGIALVGIGFLAALTWTIERAGVWLHAALTGRGGW